MAECGESELQLASSSRLGETVPGGSQSAMTDSYSDPYWPIVLSYASMFLQGSIFSREASADDWEIRASDGKTGCVGTDLNSPN